MRKHAENALTAAGFYQHWNDNEGKPPALIALLVDYAAQRPGLDPEDYGAGEPLPYRGHDWRTYYRQDSRRCTDQWQDVKRATRECYLTDARDEDVLLAAHGGRLEITPTDTGYKIAYCAGQYAATEYRAAVAAVLKRAAYLAKSRQERAA